MPAPEQSADDHVDLQIVEAIRAGGPGVSAAWQSLIRRHQDRLFGVCYRMVGTGPKAREIAADLTQDAFVKIIQGLPSFAGDAKLTTWMIRVTMNVCLSWQRAQRHRRHASLDAPVGGPNQSPDDAGAGTFAALLADREQTPPSRVQEDEVRGQIAQALSTLEGETRALLILRDVRGLEYEQIASVLNVPVGTVKSRLFRARAALREAYERLTRPPEQSDQRP
ncbi:MAG: RNA polymerase sigma factor [Phycisphaerales bacterium]|nr:RNA polymerase sigma factor [Phycisphaerales bacterium]